MKFFTIIDDAFAIIHQRGIYRQARVYLRGDVMYAGYGAGFVKLSQGGATSAPNVRWAEIDAGAGSYSEASGRVTYVAPALEAAE